MKIFEIIEQLRLDEILKNPVAKQSSQSAINYFNNLYGSSIFKGHTNVMGTPEMFANGTMVVRIMDRDRYIQYHIHTNGKVAGERNHGKDVNKAIGIAAINIIYHDAKQYLEQFKPIKILAPDPERYALYKKMAERLVGETVSNRMIVSDTKPTPDSDGIPKETFIIHSPKAKKIGDGHIVPLDGDKNEKS